MPVQVNIFILLFGVLQGIFLSVVLLQKKVQRNGYTFLLLYLVTMILQVTLKVMSKVWLLENMQPVYTLSYQLPLLYGPLIFLFTKNFLSGKRVKANGYMHFIPFSLVLYYFFVGDYRIPPPFIVAPLFNPQPRLIIELLSLCIYHGLALMYWLQYQNNLKRVHSDVKRLQAKWMQKFIVISFIACSLITVVIYLMYLWYPYNQDIRFCFIILTLFIYWISYSAWNQPQIFSVIKGSGKDEEKQSISMPEFIVHKRKRKYANSFLEDCQIKSITASLEKVMQNEKLYLDPEINIDKLASATHSSRHHVSQVLNESFGKSFYDYINGYRIDEAKRMLTNTQKDNYKIASIAYDSGFNSLSAFNEVFKKFTGITPSQFRKTLAEQYRKQRV